MKKIRYGCLALLCVLMMIGISASAAVTMEQKELHPLLPNLLQRPLKAVGEWKILRKNHPQQWMRPEQVADRAKESTGVIDGLLNDVGNGIEEGVQDVERAVEGTHASSAAETSAGR